MATMKEIAELSGVSRGTVDRVLNHRGIVNAETERKVLEIAKLLDYQPNKAGIALAAQKKKLKIGVLLFGAENPFFDEVMDGLRQKLEELSIYGCTVIERRISFDLQSQLQTIDELLKEEIHGLILSPYNDPAIQEKIDLLWENGIQPTEVMQLEVSTASPALRSTPTCLIRNGLPMSAATTTNAGRPPQGYYICFPEIMQVSVS